jgi:hypothetical protein
LKAITKIHYGRLGTHTVSIILLILLEIGVEAKMVGVGGGGGLCIAIFNIFFSFNVALRSVLFVKGNSSG